MWAAIIKGKEHTHYLDMDQIDSNTFQKFYADPMIREIHFVKPPFAHNGNKLNKKGKWTCKQQ